MRNDSSILQKDNSNHVVSFLSGNVFVETPDLHDPHDPHDPPNLHDQCPTVELKTVLTREADQEQRGGEAQDVHIRVVRFL